MIEQPIPVLPDNTNSNLKLASLNKQSGSRDYSKNGKNGTVTGAAALKNGAYSHDGVDDKIDFGDIGNIRAIEAWVNPSTTTQELFLVDTGKDIMVSSGTITYTGLTAVATYVNGAATTTLAAGQKSHIVCIFTQVDANNFETANDGTNYGAVEIEMLNVYDEVPTANWVASRFEQSVPDSSLVLHVADDCDRDLSRYKHTLTNSGCILGKGIETDGTDDKLDCGDIGNIKAISFWVDPESNTQELFLVDTGKDIMINSGTITYTGLTAAATYVNGAATTTYKGNFWQHIMCVFTQADANNFEIGTDGSNFGQFKMDDIRVYNRVPTLAEANDIYELTRSKR